MLISCVIPTRDRAAMVVEAVASVLAQQECAARLEVVVVDDGSVDGTSRMLAARFPDLEMITDKSRHLAAVAHGGRKKVAPREPLLKLVKLPGLGPGTARNAGVAAATGEIIMFLDSDDLWTPDHVRCLLPPLSAGHQVVYGVTRNQDQVGGGEFFIPEAAQACDGTCFHELLRWCFLVPSAVAVTRAAFNRVGGFSRLGLGEDWGFFLQLSQFYDFAFAGPAIITERRLHAGSLCCLPDRETLSSTLITLRDLPWQPPFQPAAAQRFAELLDWLAARREPPATVQEWYLSLKQDQML
ncbi:glycosyltransferase family 2 protein [Desulfurivibrio dismutans]|uniref:glycosyltransferase family 2 protein n=1 Tax=Desulfurivibrio dismutans TaxID=1398908 RepID=UPI0023DA245F|nr:glycosyltransferase [Desulfurivibrio alkaliphilus]MDF1613519.1 glycosyltransferase [Desulfurivibrio alkaliphilus]